ncbi:copper resistance protein CopC [Paenibacillus sp. NPDC058071]|uniref:copper resistance CopC family protein n=1 Tax=Paenibacillus sp. NPDC058071 TaxID=3346326 RepID=UPI0036DC197E
MKRILLLCLAALLLLPSVALAHSKLESSEPADGSTLSVSPERIEMTFNTHIEKLSNFKVLNDAGEAMATGKAEVDDRTMSGSIDAPLPNGSYTVKWTIIGADSHSVSGEYAFHMAAEEPVQTEAPAAETPNETAPPEEAGEPANDENNVSPSPPPSTDASETHDDTKGGSGMSDNSKLFLAAVALIVVAGASIFFFRKKGRKP